ncbi:hypothetical protein N7456_012012 [Penicillium angulare]|uniref:Apple domain-containing protein n=1 Tax=Penicillium angulare TaxID=116970 RepID=A0A9W9K0Q2_9EURO|nr:hypothetical protein N7456_012012 [Penicillium angulare]
MKIALFWASIALSAPRALAVSTETVATTATSTTSTATAASCTASLVTSLCDYPEPGSEFAVASSGKASCWDYCNANPPCDFLIFAAGNPTTGSGSCWLYPGETFNSSKGSSDCSNPTLSVYDKPVCAGGSTTTSGACTATASPSAIASVCGYPTPPDNCFDDCAASSGASDCLSECAKADSCSYVVFNADNDSHSPYASGTCWMYPNGTYNANSATSCSGSPTQFVYDNLCPKSTHSSSSLSSSATKLSSGSGIAGNTTGSATTSSSATASPSTSKNSAPVSLPLTNSLAVGVAMLTWQAFQ